MTSILRILPAGLTAAALAAAVPAASQDARRFTFTYETTIGPIEEGLGPVHVFVPIL